MTSTTTALTIIIAVIIIVAIAAWFFVRQRRSRKLRSRFGLEYDHAVAMYGSSAKAEQELLFA